MRASDPCTIGLCLGSTTMSSLTAVPSFNFGEATTKSWIMNFVVFPPVRPITPFMSENITTAL